MLLRNPGDCLIGPHGTNALELVNLNFWSYPSATICRTPTLSIRGCLRERTAVNAQNPTIIRLTRHLVQSSSKSGKRITTTVPTSVRTAFIDCIVAEHFIWKKGSAALKDIWKLMFWAQWNPESLFSCHKHRKPGQQGSGSQYSWRWLAIICSQHQRGERGKLKKDPFSGKNVARKWKLWQENVVSVYDP